MITDTADIRIDNFNKEPLIFSNDQLVRMLHLHSPDSPLIVPGCRYWLMGEERKMSLPDNQCGHQQRAWEYYWAFRLGHQECYVVLGIGTGSVGAPSELTTDKYNGVSPDTRRYPQPNEPSAMELDPDVGPWPFFDGKLGGVIFNHSFEHLTDQEHCLQEAYRVTRTGGAICILQPDMAFNARNTLDPTHTREWGADEFYEFLKRCEGTDRIHPKFEMSHIIEFNTLDNDFSFNVEIKVVS